ncbi:MAG TPA: winged helix-turn-helix domain-containing protein [Vicinamibacterales bacterium]
MPQPVFRFGPYDLDPDNGELKRDGRLVRLQPQPFKVLLHLLRSPGEVVSREELQRELWGGDTFVDFEQGLNTCVRQIRAALRDSADAPRYVQTLQRRGYRFVAPVQIVARELTPAPPVTAPGAPDSETVTAVSDPHIPEGPATRRPGTGGRRAKAILSIAAAIVLVSAAALLAGVLFDRIPFASPPGIRSIAVLPLANLSADADLEFMADGLTEALIADLARIKALRVISRTSAMQYKNTRKRVSEIAQELRVDAVIEGSVAVSGTRIRLTAQLVDAKDDRPIWSASYERDLQDALVLQRELARKVASEIRVRITPSEEKRLAEAGALNPDAYRAYLRGRYLWNRRTTASLLSALKDFERAIELDPDFAAAHSAIAETYALLGDDEFPAIPPQDALARTTEAARRALALDDGQATAWAALGVVEYMIAWDWPAAEAHFERALLVAPGDATAHQWYAWFLITQARFDEAASAMAVAQDLNPLSPIILTDRGYPAYFAGRYDEAIQRFQAALAQDANFVQAHVGLGRAYAQKGAFDESIRAFERATLLTDRAPAPLTYLARSLAFAGREAEAREILAELQRRAASEYVPPVVYAWIHTALGEEEKALDWLEIALDARSPTAPLFLVVPELQPLHGHPRFEALVESLQTEQLR